LTEEPPKKATNIFYVSDFEEVDLPGEADEELVSGGEGGTLVHGTILLSTTNRALLFSPDLDAKVGSFSSH
jgi:hypothetical protein